MEENFDICDLPLSEIAKNLSGEELFVLILMAMIFPPYEIDKTTRKKMWEFLEKKTKETE